MIFATLWTGCFALIVIDWNLSGGTWKSNGKLARRIYPAGQDTCQWFTARYSRLPHFNDGVTERFHFIESQRTSVSQYQNSIGFACFLHFSNEFLLNGRQFMMERDAFSPPLIFLSPMQSRMTSAFRATASASLNLEVSLPSKPQPSV